MTITSRHPLAGHTHPHAVPAADVDRPRPADGIELLGEYDGTGYKEPHFLARRANGAVIQLTWLLHLVAAACDGQRDHQAIAVVVSAEYGKHVTADNVRFLVDEKLRPLGVLAARDGSSPPAPDLDPLLGLKFRVQLLPPAGVQALGRLFRPLFAPPVIVAAVLALLAFDAWLFGVHGLAQGVRQTLNDPVLFLPVFGIVVASAGFHEVGHASACVYSGGKPGRMGAALYLAWPAFYTDVTDAYRLDRRGRLRTDFGGIYFNGLFLLALAGVYAVTHLEWLLLVAFLLQVEVLHQLLPFLRLDGYYVVSDLVGVPDLFRRMRPILRSALPWRPTDPDVTELKPWVRRAVTGWVAVVVPVLLANLALIVTAMPRVLTTAWDSAARLLGQFTSAPGLMRGVLALELGFLAVPVLGILITFARIGSRSGRAAWTWSSGSAPRRLGVVSSGLLVVAGLAVLWWPSQDYTPYHHGEKGTVQQHLHDSIATAAGQGTPLLRSPATAQRPLPTFADAVLRVPWPAVAGSDAPAPAAPTTAPTGSTSATATPPASASATPPTPTTSATPTTTHSASTSPTSTTSGSPTTSVTATPSPSPTATASTASSVPAYTAPATTTTTP